MPSEGPTGPRLQPTLKATGGGRGGEEEREEEKETAGEGGRAEALESRGCECAATSAEVPRRSECVRGWKHPETLSSPGNGRGPPPYEFCKL